MIEFDPTKEYTPDEYFHIIKNSRQEITDEDLQKIYDNCLELLNKYKITGQRKGAQKLLFHLSCIEKEREIVAADRKSTRLNSSHWNKSRMPSSA